MSIIPWSIAAFCMMNGTMKIITHKEVISYIKPYVGDNPIIIEIGAFIGHDTIRMAEQFPTGTIHAFEPVPELYVQLKANTSSYDNVRTYAYAVSSTEGKSVLYRAEKKSGKITQASSLQRPKDRLHHSTILFPTEIIVPTINLATWCTQENITEIDLLWLDTQGHEMTILDTVAELLPQVKTIYTEVGFIEAYEGQSDANAVVRWLNQRGFAPIARDFMEPPSWFFGNILFVNTAAR